MLLDLRFEWPVDDAGYKIVQSKYADPRADDRAGATLLFADLGPSIVRAGDTLRRYRPTEIHPTLYLDFSQLDGSDDACVKFASEFGYLGSGLLPQKEHDDLVGPAGEWLRDWREAITRLHDGVHAARHGDLPKVGFPGPLFEAFLAPRPPDGRLALYGRPRSLIGAMWLQFMEGVSEGRLIRACDHCQKLFEAGTEHRRIDAKFCSDRCRIKSNSNKRSRRDP